MSLYNLLHGVNPIAPILLTVLGIDQPDGKFSSGRFRDIYLNEDGTEIILYTRNGGGNREDYQEVFDNFAKNHPNYLSDEDDDFDCTYAYIKFSVPEKAKELIKGLVTGEKPKTIAEKFEETIKGMENMSKEDFEKDERFKPIREMFEKIVEPDNKQKEFKI